MLFAYKVTITSHPTALGRDMVMRLANIHSNAKRKTSTVIQGNSQQLCCRHAAKPKIASMSNGDDCICNHRRCDSKRNFRTSRIRIKSQRQNSVQADKTTTTVARNRAVLFRTTFGVRHVSRLGRLIFALLRRVSLAYRQVSGASHGAKSSKIARPILRGSVKPIGS